MSAAIGRANAWLEVAAPKLQGEEAAVVDARRWLRILSEVEAGTAGVSESAWRMTESVVLRRVAGLRAVVVSDPSTIAIALGAFCDPEGVVADAAASLLRMAANDAVPCLIEMLHKPTSTRVRRRVVRLSIALCPEQRLGEILASTGATEARIIREEALRALGEREGLTAVALSRLQSGLSDPEPHNRLVAACALVRHGITDKAIVSQVNAWFLDSPDACALAVRDVSRLGASAAPFCDGLLKVLCRSDELAGLSSGGMDGSTLMTWVGCSALLRLISDHVRCEVDDRGCESENGEVRLASELVRAASDRSFERARNVVRGALLGEHHGARSNAIAVLEIRSGWSAQERADGETLLVEALRDGGDGREVAAALLRRGREAADLVRGLLREAGERQRWDLVSAMQEDSEAVEEFVNDLARIRDEDRSDATRGLAARILADRGAKR